MKPLKHDHKLIESTSIQNVSIDLFEVIDDTNKICYYVFLNHVQSSNKLKNRHAANEYINIEIRTLKQYLNREMNPIFIDDYKKRFGLS